MGEKKEVLKDYLELGVGTGRLNPLGVNGIDDCIGRAGHQDFDEMEDVRTLAFSDDLKGAVRHVLDITDDVEIGGFAFGEITKIDPLHPSPKRQAHRRRLRRDHD